MKAYSVLAGYYDRLMQDFPYKKYRDYVLQNSLGKRGLDLFCGSGKMTILLSQSGYVMHGVDSSKEMLNIAAEKSRKAGQDIVFRNEKAEEFALTCKYDLITAVCDGVNYIKPANIGQLFLKIYNALSDKGIFIFDVSTPYKFNNILADNVFFEDFEDFVYVWQNESDIAKARAMMYLTFFVKDSCKYIRHDEQHTQYIYTVKELQDSLKKANLKVGGILDGNSFEKSNSKSERLVFLVTK